MSGVKRLAPFPYFGGKAKVASLIWERLGNVTNYVEPFFGSGAVLLSRPGGAGKIETVSDACGFIANFWRAMQADPKGLARACDWPVNEHDLEARHYWLVTEGRKRLAGVLGDPNGYDLQVAGWWVWGICAWIASGWCSGDGPWQWTGEAWEKRTDGQGVIRGLPDLGNTGRGVHRRAVPSIEEWFVDLSARLRRVRVAHGDWSRVCGPSVTWRHGMTGVFLDPPYSGSERVMGLYAADSGDVAARVREWAIENGTNPQMRICLAGYEGEHEMPAGWAAVRWKARGGFGNQGKGRGRENAAREILWFSPYCLSPGAERPPDLFVGGKQEGRKNFAGFQEL